MSNDALPPLSKGDLAALRASIQRCGVQVPITVRRSTGDIIDGHHRALIAKELGIEVPVTQVDGTDVEMAQLGLDLNIARRHLTHEQRTAAIVRLKELGMTARNIAAQTGVDHSTVVRLGNGANAPLSDRGKYNQRINIAERERLTSIAADLRKQGYSYQQIADAAGVTKGGISKLMRRVGRADGEHHSKPPVADPAPIEWRDPPEIRAQRSKPHTVDLPSPYQRSTVVQLVREMTEQARRDNSVNRFGHNVQDAIRAEDREWLANAETVFADAFGYLQRLMDVLRDPAARAHASDPSERDDLARLRAVK